ncbi:MAG: chemotaxis protein CheW [Myxococcota bacterium]
MAIEARRAHAPQDAIDLACFELAGRIYGVAIDRVREILPTPAITPLPDAPPVIEGIVDLRGVWVPIVDLGALLAGAGATCGARTRLVVASVGELVFGFRVDRAMEVVAVSPASFEPVPELVRSLGCRIVAAAVRRAEASPVLVLDLDVLVARVVADASPERRAEVAA